MTRPVPAAQACAAALAALPGMGPATLVRILSEGDPEEAWAGVCAGRITRPERGRPTATGVSAPASPPGGVAATLPWDGPTTAAPVGDPAAGDLFFGPRARRQRRTGEPPTGELTTAERGPARPARGRMPWAVAARQIDPAADAVRHRGAGIDVTWWGDGRYPAALAADPEPPGVLFWRGALGWLDAPTVALVGTRRCTPDGRATAFELGRDLAAAGVCVVSGLALGIDGAAHAGALAGRGAGTVGVAASGVDVVYPPRHAGLWEQVVGHGAVCSETPPQHPAQAWRFPTRNRVIAGLSRVVVVVESHRAGGSMITVDAAIRRGIEVRAVPGPVRSPASAGSNQLLVDGPAPVRHAGDVLDALGCIAEWPPKDIHLRPSRPRPTPGSRELPGGRPVRPAPPDLSPYGRAVLDAVGWRPATLNQVVEASGLPVAVVDAALDDLVAGGQVTAGSSWWCRADPP